MLCPKCQFSNTPDAKFCLVCGTSLLATTPASKNVDPFDGYLPDWLNAGSATSSSSQNFSTPSPTSNFHEPVSIEDLLNGTTNSGVFASSKSAASATNTTPPPFDVTITGNKISPLTPSPRHYAFNDGSSDSYAPPTYVPLPKNPYVPPDGSHISGVYKGCFYYPDGFGQTVVVPLAGFWSRLKGAVIDYILASILSEVFWFFAFFFIGLTKTSSGDLVPANPIVVPQSGTFVGSLTAFLVAFAFSNLIPFLYFTLIIGLSGQTFGHKWSDIRVMKKNDVSIGVFSSAVRALWGIVYSFFASAFSYIAASFAAVNFFPASPSAEAVDSKSFIWFFLFFNFLWLMLVIILMLLDKGKQAMNDKLAGTYVVKTTELARF